MFKTKEPRCVKCGDGFSAHERTRITPKGEICYFCSHPGEHAKAHARALETYQSAAKAGGPLGAFATLGLAVLASHKE